ncbi:hypothetical protein B0H14DRAFT_3530974 [Mycena olivaceomarginata]|nr:hypothetical protein B0H14DRAFT_3530974 [Mycena olivaceomarginata]
MPLCFAVVIAAALSRAACATPQSRPPLPPQSAPRRYPHCATLDDERWVEDASLGSSLEPLVAHELPLLGDIPPAALSSLPPFDGANDGFRPREAEDIRAQSSLVGGSIPVRASISFLFIPFPLNSPSLLPISFRPTIPSLPIHSALLPSPSASALLSRVSYPPLAPSVFPMRFRPWICIWSGRCGLGYIPSRLRI